MPTSFGTVIFSLVVGGAVDGAGTVAMVVDGDEKRVGDDADGRSGSVKLPIATSTATVPRGISQRFLRYQGRLSDGGGCLNDG